MMDWTPSIAEHEGYADRAERFRVAHGRWPNSNEVRRCCGSWREAIRAAGFIPMPSGVKRATRAGQSGEPVEVWTSERILAAINLWQAETGSLPTYTDWSPAHAAAEGRSSAHWSHDHRFPSAATVDQVCGSWAEAVEAATGVRRRAWRRDEALAALSDWIDREGRPPTSTEWKSAGMAPSVPVCVRLFGAWSKALLAATRSSDAQGRAAAGACAPELRAEQP